MNAIDVTGDIKYQKFFKKIKSVADFTLKYFKVKNRSLSVYIVDDKKNSQLKKQFLKNDKSKATVLSFPFPSNFPHPETKFSPLGEIFLSQKLFLKKDWPKFLIHGILHLLGYDHIKKNDMIKMIELERELWEKIISQL
jgi:probable rRNA maturation factor